MNYQGIADEVKDMVPDQELQPYFSHLKNSTKEGWIKEETLCKKRMFMQRLKSSSFKELMKAN